MSDNEKYNMGFMNPQFQRVLNNHQPTDFRAINIIKQRQKCGTLMTL